MNQRDNAHRIAHKTHNARDWLIFGNIKRQVKTRLKLAESDFVWNEIQTNKNDPSGLWKTIKRCLPIWDSMKPTYSKEPSVIAQEFNEYFTSVGQKTAGKAKEITTTINPPFDEYFNEITISEESLIFSFEPCSFL